MEEHMNMKTVSGLAATAPGAPIGIRFVAGGAVAQGALGIKTTAGQAPHMREHATTPLWRESPLAVTVKRPGGATHEDNAYDF